MKMKKIITITLSIILILSSFSFAFGQNDVTENGYIFSVDEKCEISKDAPFEYLGWNIYKAENKEDIYKYVDIRYIENIESDDELKLLSLELDPNDKYYTSGDQWNLDMMKVQSVWGYGIFGDKTKVAILDTGVNGHHEDILDDDIMDGISFADKMSAWDDVFGHGTSVASIICANQNNNIGIAGIMPDSTVIPFKVLSNVGTLTTSGFLKTLYEIVSESPMVINMSFGTRNHSEIINSACSEVINNGSILIGSSGNIGNNWKNYPASYDSVISVGSVDKNGKRSSFSQYGDVDVTAPGEGITACSADGGYKVGTLDGTSFSAPEVSALAVMAKCIDPEITSDEFRYILSKTSQYSTKTEKEGYGLVNFEKVMKYMFNEMKDERFSISYNITDASGTDYSSYTDVSTYMLKDNLSSTIDSCDEAMCLSDDSWIKVDEASYTDLKQGFYKYIATSTDGFTASNTFYTYALNRTIDVVLDDSVDKIDIGEKASDTNLTTVEILDDDPINDDLMYYAGTKLKPAVAVKYSPTGEAQDEIVLKKSIDYKAVYTNNKDVGTAAVTILGKGKYKGKVSKDFNIEKHEFNIKPTTYTDVKYTISISSETNYEIVFDSTKPEMQSDITLFGGDKVKINILSNNSSSKEISYLDRNGKKIEISNGVEFLMPSYDIEIKISDKSTSSGGFVGGGGGFYSPPVEKDEPEETKPASDTDIPKDEASLVKEELSKYKLKAISKKVTTKSGKKGIKITWKDSNELKLDFDGYEVYRSTKKNNDYVKVFDTKKKSYTNTAIKKGTRYYYRVKGYKIVDGKRYYTKNSLKAYRTA